MCSLPSQRLTSLAADAGVQGTAINDVFDACLMKPSETCQGIPMVSVPATSSCHQVCAAW